MPPPLDIAPHQRRRLGAAGGAQNEGQHHADNNNPFLPAWDEDDLQRQQRRVGAREIWNRTRRPTAGSWDVVKAVAFELQPIRCSTMVYYIRKSPRYVKPVLQLCGKAVMVWLKSLQWFASLSYKAATHATWKDWALLFGIIGYCYIIRQAHRLFHAGPMVLVLTGLFIILTIGLDDDSSNNKKGLSAYSVFNRQCRAILGSIDVESLVNQYVGGGVGAMINNNNNQDQGRGAGDGGGQAGPRRQHVHAHQQHQHGENGNGNNNRARRSGKKARRDQQTLEHRRDRQRQRQEAAAMGFGNEGGDDQMAMHRLLEEQAAFAEEQFEDEHDFSDEE
jgi:hypothetical protein